MRHQPTLAVVFLVALSASAAFADAPNVTLIAPNRDALFVTPAAPVFYATAFAGNTSPPSSVARVDFLDGEMVIGTVTTANSDPTGHGYAFAWNNPPLGVHLITARVTDTLGYSMTATDRLTLSIVDPGPPVQIGLSSPTTGQIFTSAGSVFLTATVTGTQATIQRVEFVAGTIVVATAFRPPYSATWNNPPPGDFMLVARAVDDRGLLIASSAAYIKVLAAPRQPSVVMTAPAPGATIASGAPLMLAADALAPDGGVAHVDFYAGTTLVGSAATTPYQVSWANPTAGTLSLIAKAYDLRGKIGASTPVAVTVSSNPPPTVALTAPANNSAYPAPATISLSAIATANNIGGSITRVDFYSGGTTLLGSATTAPFAFSWANVAAGSYVLTAKATDNLGTSATSGPTNVTVSGNAAPSVSLTAPQSGAQYAQGQPIVLTASASSPARTIDRVEFYADAALLRVVTVPGSIATATVSFTWNGAGVGAHALSAKVFATDGANAASASVNISVGDLGVALTEPFAGQVYQAPAQIRITANPTETTGTITRVDFYSDGALLGSATTPPYTILWSGVAVGSHTVTATARDSAGFSASSAPAAISVVASSTLQVDAGIDGSSIADDNTSISGTVQAPANSAVSVNGQAAALAPNGRFFIGDIELLPGTNVLTVAVNTLEGAPIVRTINVASTGVAPFKVSLDKQEGFSPLTVNLTITNRGNVPFQRIEIDWTGDGTADTTMTSLVDNERRIAVTYNNAGTYPIRVAVYDSSNTVVYSATRTVRVYSKAELGLKLVGAYVAMVDRLGANDASGALRYFTADAQTRYRVVFDALAGMLPSVAAQLRTIIDGAITEDTAELTILENTTSGQEAFMIYLIRGGDGIWRIENM